FHQCAGATGIALCSVHVTGNRQCSTVIRNEGGGVCSDFSQHLLFSYGLYHSARKTLSGVKTSVTSDWLDNVTHVPLFNTDGEAKTFLGTLDAVFMIAYASGLFFWGWLGDRLNPKHVIVTGMIGSAVMV
ncbi:hypothetical protein OSTOST_07293, partial [Ostertagia ostertagi]